MGFRSFFGCAKQEEEEASTEFDWLRDQDDRDDNSSNQFWTPLRQVGAGCALLVVGSAMIAVAETCTNDSTAQLSMLLAGGLMAIVGVIILLAIFASWCKSNEEVPLQQETAKGSRGFPRTTSHTSLPGLPTEEDSRFEDEDDEGQPLSPIRDGLVN